jgi:predicted lipoprotein with Yx(FWY)xxD motif
MISSRATAAVACCALLRPPGAGVFPLRSRAVGRHRKVKLGDWRQPWLRVAGALLLVVSAGIHLDLYLTGYRSIPTIGWLFLLQFLVAFVLAIGALVTHSRLVAVAGAAFALSTLGCYLLAVWIGLFGYKEIRTRAGIAAGLIEVAAFATLALAVAIAGARQAAPPARPRPRVMAGMRAAVSLVVGAVGAVSVAALVLFGIALASTGGGGEPASAADTGVTLKTATIGGVTVLTSANGFTLYWFVPDSPSASRCTGSCAAYWSPVTGTPAAGPGVTTGKLGTIKRPGGTTQATYDGHPLYTYVGDNAPGQARGNKLDLNGGYWYEVRA